MASSNSTTAIIQKANSDRQYYLIEWAHKHVDFQLSEVASVFEMSRLIDECMVHPLPRQATAKEDNYPLSFAEYYKRRRTKWNTKNHPSKNGTDICTGNQDKGSESRTEGEENNQENEDECDNDATMTNGEDVDAKNNNKRNVTIADGDSKQQKENNSNTELHRSFLIISFPRVSSSLDKTLETRLVETLSQCVLVRGVIELWSADIDLDVCSKAFQKEFSNNNDHFLVQRYCLDPEKSWKMTIATQGTKYTRDEQNEMRLQFSDYLPFQGPVQMKDPSEEFVLIREIELDLKGSALYPRHSHDKTLNALNDKRPPLAVYFGRVLGKEGRNMREKWDPYKLPKRSYLGPTSMDFELSMIMTNLAQVHKDRMCFDPFVGTGSILLTCALKGGMCFGSDIDLRVIRGKSSKENVYENFKQFQLPRPELVRSDNSFFDRHYRQGRTFHAIVCDPPYGIRAGARKSGTRFDGEVKPVPEDQRHDHIAQTKPYPVSDVMTDLLNVAAETLEMDVGRLVYIIPSLTNDNFDPDVDLPQHPCLKLVDCCYQPLQLYLGRRVVVMKKVMEYDPTRKELYKEQTWINGPESADQVANLRQKMLEEARKKPGYIEKCEYRASQRKKRRQENKKQKQNEHTKN